MPVKRAHTNEKAFDNPTAIEKLVSGGAGQEVAEEERVGIATEEREHKPTSFYLTDDALRKLDRLAYEYNQQTGKRINRNHIVRHLVEDVSLGDLLKFDLQPKKKKKH